VVLVAIRPKNVCLRSFQINSRTPSRHVAQASLVDTHGDSSQRYAAFFFFFRVDGLMDVSPTSFFSRSKSLSFVVAVLSLCCMLFLSPHPDNC
jgi:hypothetical protein